MSYAWNAKVHKSGNKVAVFDGSKLLRIVETSKDTFEPAEAQKFAEELVSELNTRTATHSGASPMVTTKAEQHAADLAAVAQPATGKPVSQMPIEEVMAPTEKEPEAVAPAKEEEDAAACEKKEEEALKNSSIELRNMVSSLQKKLAKEKEERQIERKARRGLAIAKQMVVEGKLEDSYDAIKNKVAEIIKLETSEIDRLERKVAGEHEFESVEDAQREIRRLNRISRINRQAAAEAQQDLDETQADMLDKTADEADIKAEHVLQIVAEMSKTEKKDEEKPAEEKKEAEKPAEEKKEEPAEKEAKKTETPVEEKKEAKEIPPAEAAPDGTEEDEAACEKENQAALARKYRRIATTHRKLAGVHEAKGDIKSADDEDAAADEAETKAEEIEKKLAAIKVVAEEKKEEEKPVEETEKSTDDKKDEEDAVNPTVAAPKGEASDVQPTASVEKTSALKREGKEVVEESFGIDKNASLVEQNDYTGDPEVELLSTMWKSAPKDE